MSYGPNQMYPGATELDPNYPKDKFKDNNPSTTNNGTPLKAIKENQDLTLETAVMNDAGFEYNGLPDKPDDSQLFAAYKASLGNGTNLLSNHNFLIQTPDDSQPLPSATPTSYPPGYQIFSGVFANETTGITNLTYIDGRVSFSGGGLYFSVPNSGAIARLTAAQLSASVADFDGKPRTRGVSFALVGDEYRVTVGIDALEDAAANPTPLGSVKFEQGIVATSHAIGTKFEFRKTAIRLYRVVEREVLSGLVSLGDRVNWDGYDEQSDGGSNWGIVKVGAHVEDGGSIFSIDTNTYIEANLKGKSINVAKFGSTGVGDSLDATSRLNACFAYCDNVDVGGDASYGIPAKLPIGEHYITSNVTLPDGGLHGVEMSQSRILVDENITGDAVTMGDSAAGNLFRGSVRDLRIQARTDDFAGRCLRVNRPNQGAEVRNVYLYVGNGVGLGLKDSFNLGTYNVVITSRFNGNLPTDPSNALIGSGIEQIDGTEMNDLLFTRIDMRHLRHCLVGATSIANGTNTIKFQSCVIENIGNMLFNLDGWNVDFDNVYIENIYRNRNVAGEPVPVATVARGGAGRCAFSNGGILNLGLPNDNTISPFRWIEGDVEFNSAKLRNYGDDVDPVQKVTFSSSGILKAENSELAGGISGIERKGTQDKSNVYPENFKEGSEIYTPLYIDGWKCGGNLQAVGKPTAPQFAHYANLGICSVEGNIKTHHSVLTVDVTFYRYSLTSISCEFKKLRLHFLIRPNCTATISPFKITTIEEVVTSDVWGSNFESSIIARRRTPERTDPDYNNEYTFHYQIEVAGESGGTTENTSETNDVNAQIVWVHSSNADENTPPNYTLYQQNGFVPT